ncbi:hypothetical protein V3C99_010678 [Haemonchus contortus]|uniref:SBDS_C domain-containing protein n=1 Tax=Haemonchus contortus TaxID=6289 RepID=A0A7I4Y6M6_HAECO|nr:unnamed protein product [Haemonchus contortus]
MSLDGPANDEKTISVHLYEPFEVTRIAQIIPPSPADSTSIARVRSILNKADVTEVNAEQGDFAEKALNALRDEDATTPQFEQVIASIIPKRSPIDQAHTVMH